MPIPIIPPIKLGRTATDSETPSNWKKKPVRKKIEEVYRSSG